MNVIHVRLRALSVLRLPVIGLILVMSAPHAALGQTIPRLGGDFEELWVTEREFGWTEGPAYDGVGGVWFADMGQVFVPSLPTRVLRFDIASGMTETVIGVDENPAATGLAFDDMGRLVAANAPLGMATRRPVDQLDQVEVLFDNFQGMPVRPNDLAIDAEGGIYFSNPFFPPEDSTVLYLPPTGDVQQVATGLIFSNGIGLSPDGKTLYVAQSPLNSISAYDVNDDHTLSNQRLFATVPGGPDGMTVDRFGNVYSSDLGWTMGPPDEITGLPGSMVRVWNPAGEEILTFEPPQGAINLGFGAPDDTLYIAGWNSLYRVPIEYNLPPGIADNPGLDNPGLRGKLPPGLRDGLPSRSHHSVPEPASAALLLLACSISFLVRRY